MKKGLIFSIIVFIVFLTISTVFLFIPGINRIVDSDNIEVKTDEEIQILINDINDKYTKLKQEQEEKYLNQLQDIDTKYKDEYKKLDDKYIKLKEEHEAKYNKIEADIKAKYQKLIDAVEAKYDLPMTHPSWYDNQVKAGKEKSALQSQMYDEIREKTAGKTEESFRLSSNKRDEENLIDDAKDVEERNVEVNKLNDAKLLESNKEKELNNVNNYANEKEDLFYEGITLIIFGVLVILIYPVYILITHNKLTKNLNAVKESLSTIEVLLKRRFDLLPNYISVVKGYKKHEKEALKEVIEARNKFELATTLKEEIDADKVLSENVNRLIMLTEDYPELKSNTNFMALQYELKNTEDQIANARYRYNKMVLKYKNSINTFPSNMIADLFKFKEEEFFDIDESEKENVKV